jgi:N6-L-threonylcarbamoyladenine synthase
VDILAERTLEAAASCGVRAITLSGGVAANLALREHLEQESSPRGFRVITPSLPLCTDNAAMVAGLGEHLLQARRQASLDLNAFARMEVASWA